jgi:hypothetical protein
MQLIRELPKAKGRCFLRAGLFGYQRLRSQLPMDKNDLINRRDTQNVLMPA